MTRCYAKPSLMNHGSESALQPHQFSACLWGRTSIRYDMTRTCCIPLMGCFVESTNDRVCCPICYDVYHEYLNVRVNDMTNADEHNQSKEVDAILRSAENRPEQLGSIHI